MRRPLLTAALFLTLLFAACIGLIRAQPYDDSELRAFLAPPEGCPAPCFMGIRPGVTTVYEAAAMLEAHEWVGEVSILSNTGGILRLQWDWSGKQPVWVDASTSPFINVVEERLISITIGTDFTLGDILLELGKPDWSSIIVMGILGQSARHQRSLKYQHGALAVFAASTPCSAGVNEILHVPVSIQLLADDIAQDATNSFWEWSPPCGS